MALRASLAVCAVVVGVLSGSRGAQRGLGGTRPGDEGIVLGTARGVASPVVQCMARRQAFAERDRPTPSASVQDRGVALGCPLETLTHSRDGHSAYEQSSVVPLNQPATRAAQRRHPEHCCYNFPSSLPGRPNG